MEARRQQAPCHGRGREGRRVRPRKANRLRFGILAARHALERDRLTADQVDYLENCRTIGWRKEDAWAAYWREAIRAAGRTLIE